MPPPVKRFALFCPSLLLLLAGLQAPAATTGTLTLKTNAFGNTPNLLAYNAGHFYPGSNTREWWHYAGVTGARVFLTASIIEATDDIPGRGDGVTNQTSFLLRKAALRADPTNLSYINWPAFTNAYNTIAKHGANRLQPNYIFTELRKLGVQIDVNIGASQNFFIITDSSDWAGKWELWQHYYAEAFYLGRGFDVQRYQMFNEPDHPNAGGLTLADYLQRLQLCSDAIQSALADVNSIYSKSLVPKIVAPVITTSSYGTWAQNVVTNRHLNYLGQTDVNFWLLHQYDYHQYNSTPATFGANVASLRSSIAAAMSPETPLPVSISEFNVHTAANFDAIPDTLDYPTKYPRLGAIFVNLVQNGASELYNFKFSQTDGDVGDNYPVRKNGMHYVDNDGAPYNTGGITKGGETWRLFNKAFAPGRLRRDFTADTSLANLALLASYDPATGRYYVFSANDSSSTNLLTVDLSALKTPDNNRVLIEEVSEGSYGSVAQYARVVGGKVSGLTQPTNSVWLITIPGKPQLAVSPGEPTLLLSASEDATVKDGANKNINYGSQTNLIVRNDPANAANRSAAFLKFHLPAINLPDLQLAVLSVYGSTLTTNAASQAHVYGLTNNNWSQGAVTWASAPNLRPNVPAGNHITNNFVNGLGDATFLQGQLVFSSTNVVEMQIDVTDFIRGRTNSDVTFLISQDPRWNVTLPSLASGDTQPDGLRIISTEGAGGIPAPRLKLVRADVPSAPSGLIATPVSTSQINLVWRDNSTTETGFIVASSTNSGGPYADLVTVPPNVTNYANGGLPQNTTYYYVVRAANGLAESTSSAEASATTLAINPQAPAITSQPQSLAVRAGQPATFSVVATGTPVLRYQWRFNGTPISAATSSALTILSAGPTNVGAYSVRITNVYGVALSDDAMLGLTTIAAAGDNSFGQTTLPFSVTNVIAVAAGAWHSLALRADGGVAAWGDNEAGQCTVPPTLTDALAIAAGGYHSLAIKANGAIVAWGANDYAQTNIPAGLGNMMGISAGTWHSLALRSDGTVAAWGDNSWGQTNLPAGLSNVVFVAAGGNHNLALKADGTVAAWGENSNGGGIFVGQSVVPSDLSNVVAISAGEYHSLAVKSDGTVIAWGDDSQNQSTVPPGLSNVVAVAGGGAHSLALSADGTVTAWGANWNGQRDISATWFPAVGIAAGGSHTLVLSEGTLPVPRLFNPSWQGRRFTAVAQTLNRKNYALEYKDSLAATTWTTPSGVSGNGALRLLTDATPAGSQRFYRMRQW